MEKDDIKVLINHAEDLLDYFKKYSKYIVLADDALIYKEHNPPTRRVVTGIDYISAYIDMMNALVFIEKAEKKDVVEYINQLRVEIVKIIDGIICVNYIINSLNDLNEIYEHNMNLIGDDDLLYFELTCGNRDTIEELLKAMTDFYKISKEDTLLATILEKVKKLDDTFKIVLARIERSYPKLRKPLPYHPFYTPSYYWWYLKN